jgi:eukaryotic-like serine/threonine-protein kinase
MKSPEGGPLPCASPRWPGARGPEAPLRSQTRGSDHVNRAREGRGGLFAHLAVAWSAKRLFGFAWACLTRPAVHSVIKDQGAVIGQRINNYEILSLLGEGGMGAVYLAEHPLMGRKAAVKFLRKELSEDKTLVARFVNEARAANAIRHRNIIDIIDVGTLPDQGQPYMMMEFLDGESLAQRLKRVERLPVSEALAIVAQTASALSAAHAKGIVHRDLKPDNLFLVPDELGAGDERVKVLDFGIAKLRGEIGSGSVKTNAGSIMGTPPYMSPEQCRGINDEIDQRTDVYALGIILYEMLTGAPPFQSEGFGEVLVMHLLQAPPSPRQKNPEIPEEVERAILRALTKKREERFASMAELQAALGRPAQRLTGVTPAAGRLSAVSPVANFSTSVRPDDGAGARADLGLTARASTAEARATTTLSAAAGEMPDLGMAPGAPLSAGKRRKLLIIGAAGAAALGGLILVFVAGGGGSSPAAPTPSTSAAVAAPSGDELVLPASQETPPAIPAVVPSQAEETPSATEEASENKEVARKTARRSGSAKPAAKAAAARSGTAPKATATAPTPGVTTQPPAGAAPKPAGKRPQKW